MTQTIGYHTSDLEDADTLAEIAQTYGDRLEALDKGDKFGLLRQISDELNK